MTVYSHQYWSMYSLSQPKGFWNIKKEASNALVLPQLTVIDDNEQEKKDS